MPDKPGEQPSRDQDVKDRPNRPDEAWQRAESKQWREEIEHRIERTERGSEWLARVRRI